MSDRVFSGTVDLSGLQAFVDSLRHSARFAIVERIDAIDFPPPQSESIDVRDWPKGRIFDEAFELRWERFGQEYRVIVASEVDSSFRESRLNEQDLPPGAGELLSYYCWNETNPRLGRTLDYRCVPGQGDVKLSVRECRDDYGRLAFWRYVKMERDGGDQ
jgi:hypothetical protein